MMRTIYAVLVVLVVGLVVQAQQPQAPPKLPDCVGGDHPSPGPCDDSMFPDFERRIPPQHYCKAAGVTIRPSETMAHSCDCKYSCTIDEQGNVTDHESSECLAYCHINGRRCTCHPEGDPSVTCTPGLQPGDPITSRGLVDMDGHLVAVRIR